MAIVVLSAGVISTEANYRGTLRGVNRRVEEDPRLWSILLDNRRLERLVLRDERCECEILFGLESEDGCTRRVGSLLFGVLGHGGVRKLDFDDQLAAMFLEIEHGEVNYVDSLSTLQQELVMGRSDIISLTANLEESAPICSGT